MNLETAKKAADVTIDGVKVEYETVDGMVRSVTLTDAKGHVVRVMSSGSYSDAIKVLVPAKPKTEKKFVVRGTVAPGVPVEVVCDSEYGATSKLDEIKNDNSDLRVVEEAREVEMPF